RPSDGPLELEQAITARHVAGRTLCPEHLVEDLQGPCRRDGGDEHGECHDAEAPSEPGNGGEGVGAHGAHLPTLSWLVKSDSHECSPRPGFAAARRPPG